MLDHLPIPRINDISYTIFCSTITGEIRIGFRIIGIVVLIGQFFPSLDIPQGYNPDTARGGLYRTIGVTRMVNITGCILEDFAVNIIPSVEITNIGVTVS